MKKKILMLAVAACLIVLSIAGSSLAYFTDKDEATNVFTSGNGVDITLEYDFTKAKTTVRYPGVSYDDESAKITLAQNSEEAYVGAIITLSKADLKNIMTATGTQGNIPAAISSIFVGLDTTKCVEGTNSYTIYVVAGKLTQTDANTKTATIFSGISIPKEWNTTEMQIFNNMEIEVTAYAVQTPGFEDGAALAALKAAFSDWESCPA